MEVVQAAFNLRQKVNLAGQHNADTAMQLRGVNK
jgi:hypothetical protein